ncbi:hypothetical protein MVES1_003477 [Malassezia vespertilionis]|uniref:Major facilitator superfamily (MFS) profile domain-containing protein n=1 Tax=Malassezia vespertilionis TaxID=2020962 RepID=A0A2N1J716_9BASI|nr:uncharacterized protein MVES1_003477 [Malassezia vespertilionis]PKI82355.1 hypothetical protein MVES_003716 [Malassezia vespertilionis]WFD08108.1 hypothetical protein MVES1_003477 [Malassezia vespertilionis]
MDYADTMDHADKQQALQDEQQLSPHDIVEEPQQRDSSTQHIIGPDDRKFSWKKMGTIAACGAALFSDGYVNNSIGNVNTMLSGLYPTVYGSDANNNLSETLTAIAFAGTVVGMLLFGYFSDAIGRKSGMIGATVIILIFTALSAGSYYKGQTEGMIQMLIAWRFFTGIGIGAEYPTGSVSAAEKTEEMPKKFQHGPFIFVTNFAIDLGFVAGSFVPLVLTWICGENHNRLIWRLTLGLGVVPCLLVLPFRAVMQQSKLYNQGKLKTAQIPYILTLKYYWFRLLMISLVWFIYDFISYPFGIYSSLITTELMGGADAAGNKPQWVTFGWSCLINTFYLPGAFAGAALVDTLGPKRTFQTGLVLQIIIGFIMSGLFDKLKVHPAAFCVVYGLFLTFGEMGPGDNLGLIASKSCATCVKGQFYGIAAAIGKIGAFGGTYAFPAFRSNYDETDSRYYTAPFYLGSALACVSLILLTFCIKERNADCQATEEEAFRAYLRQNGFDLNLMGRQDSMDTALTGSLESIDEKKAM